MSLGYSITMRSVRKREKSLKGVVILAALLFAGCKEPPTSKPLPRAGDVQRGRLLIEQLGCTACHIIPGLEGARGMLGPSLDHVATRALLAGKIENTPANMARWIQNPQAFDPSNSMPALGLSDQDARDVTAYLFSLK